MALEEKLSIHQEDVERLHSVRETFDLLVALKEPS